MDEVSMQDIIELLNGKGLKAHWLSAHEDIGFSIACRLEQVFRAWREGNPDEKIEDISDLASIGVVKSARLGTIKEALEVYIGTKRRKTAELAVGRTCASAALKATYMPLTTLALRQVKPKGAFSWAVESSVRGSGLMQAVFADSKVPVTFPVQCSAVQPKEDHESFEEQLEMIRALLPPSAREQLEKEGLVVSQNKTVWNTMAPAWELLKKTFPNAVEATPYNHSLTAPTYPGGIFLHQKVVIKNILDEQGEIIGADGSGRAHPEHQIFKQLNRPGGKAYVEQWRGINADGWFIKGVVVPDERCVDKDGNPEIWVDPRQVKGLHKPDAAVLRDSGDELELEMHIGVIQVWDNPRMKTSWCFEVLECIKTTPRTKELMKSLLLENVAKLEKRGVEGLIRDAADSSPAVKMAMDIITAMNAAGAKINPLSIPWIRETMKARLGKTLYRLAQAAGVQVPTRVAIIDNSLEEGTCVVSGHDPGTRLAVARIPVVLSQGIRTVEAVTPHSYHMVGGKVVPNTIFLNEYDLVLGMMGDDDGDVVMVSDDERIVELHDNRISEGRGQMFAIEPKGDKKVIPTDSKEGRDYMAVDPRGPVGPMTVRRARLLAVGDYSGALALSLLIQEAIDKAKRLVKWSDYRMAVDTAAWKQHAEAWVFDSEKYNLGTELDDKALRKWIAKRIDIATGHDGDNAPNVIPWRHQDKKINPESWHPCWIAGGWPTSDWIQGNLVHYVHDVAREEWLKIADKFQTGDSVDVPMEDLLYCLMVKTYPTISLNKAMEWETYRNNLRDGAFGCDAEPGKPAKRPTGLKLRTFGDSRRKAMSIPDLVERNRQMEDATVSLHSHLRNRFLDDKTQLVQDLCQGWYMECRYSGTKGRNAKGNVNNAFYLTSWTGSPVLEVLGLQDEQACDFLTASIERKAVTMILQTANPFESLGAMFLKSEKHKAAKGISMVHCKFCMEKAQSALIRAIRANHATRHSGFYEGLLDTLRDVSPKGDISVEVEADIPDADDYGFFE